ncbi:hypothetical protein [Phyllobacterium zundukense]|uniref:Uncharacterized protein n=1 Tax=Phyllobacterium zundukense TaxID=1867719 RepID=A0ACD4CX47_9HYPH|nr:hypothetical protein [Phyllobacterium zundukense]UXN58144.1 hypothetical protein N8E88_04790 [Phyllobacterium zundukense]
MRRIAEDFVNWMKWCGKSREVGHQQFAGEILVQEPYYPRAANRKIALMVGIGF